MHELDFLENFCPNRTQSRVWFQHDLYHRYTSGVDEHTLRADRAFDDLDPLGAAETERIEICTRDPATRPLRILGLLMQTSARDLGGNHIGEGDRLAKGRLTRLKPNRE